MTGAEASKLGHEMFERYLTERGYTWERELPNPDDQRRPDYRLATATGGVVCELKSFAAGGFFAATGSGMVGSRAMGDVLAPLRADIREAARQLRGARSTGMPLVAVLSNPLHLLIPTDVRMVAAAMYGDPQMEAPVLDDGTLGEFTMAAGRNGRLTNDHPYISAVAVLHLRYHEADWARTWIRDHRTEFVDDRPGLLAALMEAVEADGPGGDDVYLDVIETISPDAVPLPRKVFDGPLDSRYALNENGSAIEAVG